MVAAGVFFFVEDDARSETSDEEEKEGDEEDEDEDEEEEWGRDSEEGGEKGHRPLVSPRLAEKLHQVEAEDLSNVLRRLDSIRQLAGDAQLIRHREAREETARQMAVDQLYSLLLEEAGFQAQAVMQRGLLAVLEGIKQKSAEVFFFSAEEARRGCDGGPSLQLREGSMPRRFAERLQVTPELLERMLAELQTSQIRDLVSKVGEYLAFKQTSYQVKAVEEKDGALVKNATGLAVFKNWTLVTDALSHCLWKVLTNSFNDEGNHKVELFAGLVDSPGLQDGPLLQARFRSPMGVVVCEDIGAAFVADTDNNAVRRIDLLEEVVSTLDLSPAPFVRTLLRAELTRPKGLCAIRGSPTVLASMDYRQKRVCDEVQKQIDALTMQQNAGSLSGGEESSSFGCSTASSSSSSSSSGSSWGVSRSSGSPAKGATVPKSLAALREEQMTLEQSLSVVQIKRYAVLQDMEDPAVSHASKPPTPPAEGGRARSDVFPRGASSRRLSTSSSLGSPRAEEAPEQVALRLAITADHCVWLVDPETGQAQIIAGDPVQYGYCDAPLGLDARFSSPKGIINVRSALFVADYWNNVVRCINLYTSQVDTVMDFKPQGPVAMCLSSSGVLYTLDSEGIHHANILGIMSTQCGDSSSGVPGASPSMKSEYQTLFPNPRTRSESVYSDSTLVHSEIWDAVRRKSCGRGGSSGYSSAETACPQPPSADSGPHSEASVPGDFHSRLEAHLQRAAEGLEDDLQRRKNRRLKAHARKTAARASGLAAGLAADAPAAAAAGPDGPRRSRRSVKGPLASPAPLEHEAWAPPVEPGPREWAQGARGRATLTRSLQQPLRLLLDQQREAAVAEEGPGEGSEDDGEEGASPPQDGGPPPGRPGLRSSPLGGSEPRALLPLPALLPVPEPWRAEAQAEVPIQVAPVLIAPRITITAFGEAGAACADEASTVGLSAPRILVTPSSEQGGHYVDEVKRRLSAMGSRRVSVSGFDSMPLTLGDLGVEGRFSRRGSMAAGTEGQHGHRGSVTAAMRRRVSELAQDSGIGAPLAGASMDKDRYLVVQENARRGSSSAADAGTVMVRGGRALYRAANESWSDKRHAPDGLAVPGAPGSRRASVADSAAGSPWGGLARTVGEDEDGNPVIFVDLTLRVSLHGSCEMDPSRRGSFQAGLFDRYLDGSRRASSVGLASDVQQALQRGLAAEPTPGRGPLFGRRPSNLGVAGVPPLAGSRRGSGAALAAPEESLGAGPLLGYGGPGLRRPSLGAGAAGDRRGSLGIAEGHRTSLMAPGVGNRRASVGSRRGSVMIMPTVLDTGDQDEDEEETVEPVDAGGIKWTVPTVALMEESASDKEGGTADDEEAASEHWGPGKSDGAGSTREQRGQGSSEGSSSEVWVNKNAGTAEKECSGSVLTSSGGDNADSAQGDPAAVSRRWPTDDHEAGKRTLFSRMLGGAPEEEADSGVQTPAPSEASSSGFVSLCDVPFTRDIDLEALSPCAGSPTGREGREDAAAFPDLASSSALRRRTTMATSVAGGHATGGYKVAEQVASTTWRPIALPEPLSTVSHGGRARKYPNTPLSMVCLEDLPCGDFLLVGLVFAPTLLKVIPPKHHEPDVGGRFNALPIDSRRFLLADEASHQIWLVNCAAKTRAHVAGCGKRGYLDGPLGTCRMHSPCSLALDPHTHHIYVADKGNHAIRRLDLQSGLASTVAGSGCRGSRDGSDRRCQALDSPFEVSFAAPHHLVISCADNSVRSLDLRTGHLATLLIGA